MIEVEFKVEGTSVSVQADERDTLLDTALRNQVPAPYSCLEGVCRSCLAKLVEGSVRGEVEEGSLILTCQARPALGCTRVVVDYGI